ncbi:MAG: EAL domain-containing protein [Pseudomonadales bacterium]|nr:EAL domain-containing protein [Pseudomonadales bacterium]
MREQETAQLAVLDSGDFPDLAGLRRALGEHTEGGRSCLLLIDEDELEALRLQIDASPSIDFLVRPFTAEQMKLRMNKLGAVVSALQNAAAAVDSLQNQLDRLGYQDRLTGLPSSAFFERHLTYEIRHAQRYGRQLAVLAVDCRPAPGAVALSTVVKEALLSGMAERLVQELRNHDVIGQTANLIAEDRSSGGSDRWRLLIVLSEFKRLKDVTAIAGRLVDALADEFIVDDIVYGLEARFGISIFPADGESQEALIRNAQIAVAHVDEQKLGGFAFFSDSINRLVADRAAVEKRLRTALEGGAFHLLYQPRVDFDGEATTGLEALVRWQDEELGNIPPAKFIPLAEELDLIGEVTRWVLGEACRQSRRWQDAGIPAVPVAVNLSGRDYLRSDFPDFVSGILLDNGIAPRLLELEITESELPEHLNTAVAVLEELRKIGVGITLDGFGKESMLLGQLHQMPIDVVKIDRSFVRHITEDWSSAAVTAGVINLARSLKLRVVAEGVETTEQIELLQEQGCSEGQGAVFSMPLAPDVAQQWLQSRLDGG